VSDAEHTPLNEAPPPPQHLSLWQQTKNRLIWFSKSAPATNNDFELRQLGVRTHLLRVLGILLVGTVLAALEMLGLSVLKTFEFLESAGKDAPILELRLKTIGVIAGTSAFALVGALLLLGKAIHPPTKHEDPWRGFPTAVTEVCGEIAKIAREWILKRGGGA
jgi:hypothetical protein